MSRRERIKVNARWLLAHSGYWSGLSGQTATIERNISSIVIPAGTLDWPGLALLKAKYTETAQKISTLYGEGTAHTALTSELLNATARAYIRTESENEALSQSILAEMEDEF